MGQSQDISKGCLSFKAEKSGGRKVGKRPALLMLQDSMVSMATPAAFSSLGGCHKETVDITTTSWWGEAVAGGVVMGVDVTTTLCGEGGREVTGGRP